jgi:hypothetical protein
MDRKLLPSPYLRGLSLKPFHQCLRLHIIWPHPQALKPIKGIFGMLELIHRCWAMRARPECVVRAKLGNLTKIIRIHPPPPASPLHDMTLLPQAGGEGREGLTCSRSPTTPPAHTAYPALCQLSRKSPVSPTPPDRQRLFYEHSWSILYIVGWSFCLFGASTRWLVVDAVVVYGSDRRSVRYRFVPASQIRLAVAHTLMLWRWLALRRSILWRLWYCRAGDELRRDHKKRRRESIEGLFI